MLIRRIGIGSIDLGLYEAGEDLQKGRAVTLKNNKIVYPTDKTDVILGFVQGVIRTKEGSDLEHDIEKAGKKVVVQTLVSNNMFATDQYAGTPAKGEKLAVEVGTGKVIKYTDGVSTTQALFTCDGLSVAAGHTFCELFVI